MSTHRERSRTNETELNSEAPALQGTRAHTSGADGNPKGTQNYRKDNALGTHSGPLSGHILDTHGNNSSNNTRNYGFRFISQERGKAARATLLVALPGLMSPTRTPNRNNGAPMGPKEPHFNLSPSWASLEPKPFNPTHSRTAQCFLEDCTAGPASQTYSRFVAVARPFHISGRKLVPHFGPKMWNEFVRPMKKVE